MADSSLDPTNISKSLGNFGQSDLQSTSPSPNMIQFNSTNTGGNNKTMLTTFKNVSIHVLQVMICIFIITGNLIIIIAIRRSEKLKTVYHFWIAHLAIADFVAGILIAIQIFLSANDFTTIIGCRIFFAAVMPTFSASIFGFLMVSYTSYTSIRSSIPIVKLDRLERRRVKMQIGCVWLFWMIFHLTGMFWLDSSIPMYTYIQSCSVVTAHVDRTFLFVVSIVILLKVIIVGIFQCMIIKDVNAHTEKMLQIGIYALQNCKKADKKSDKSCEVSLPSDNNSPPSTCIEGQDSDQFGPTTTTRSKCPSQIAKPCVKSDPKQTYKVLSQSEIQYQIWIKKVSKLTKTMAIVFSMFAICTMPHNINLILLCTCPDDFCQDEMLLAITGTFMAFNSVANVIVYTIRNKDFRDEFKNILCLRGKMQI